VRTVGSTKHIQMRAHKVLVMKREGNSEELLRDIVSGGKNLCWLVIFIRLV
jgi:hypothetical protein